MTPRKPAHNMREDGLALVTHPITDDISAGRVILHRSGLLAENSYIEDFTDHCQQFFTAWAK